MPKFPVDAPRSRAHRTSTVLVASLAIAAGAALVALGLWLFLMTGDGKPQPRPFSLDHRPGWGNSVVWIITSKELWPNKLVIQRVSLNGEWDAPVAYSDPSRDPPISLDGGEDVGFLQDRTAYPKGIDFVDVYTNLGRFRCDPGEKRSK